MSEFANLVLLKSIQTQKCLPLGQLRVWSGSMWPWEGGSSISMSLHDITSSIARHDNTQTFRQLDAAVASGDFEALPCTKLLHGKIRYEDKIDDDDDAQDEIVNSSLSLKLYSPIVIANGLGIR
jgi:hypothetical protein